MAKIERIKSHTVGNLIEYMNDWMWSNYKAKVISTQIIKDDEADYFTYIGIITYEENR